MIPCDVCDVWHDEKAFNENACPILSEIKIKGYTWKDIVEISWGGNT